MNKILKLFTVSLGLTASAAYADYQLAWAIPTCRAPLDWPISRQTQNCGHTPGL